MRCNSTAHPYRRYARAPDTVCAGLATFCALVAGTVALAAAPVEPLVRVARVLDVTPLIDGHNDLPWQIRERFKGSVAGVNLARDTSHITPPEGHVALMTDLPRLRTGHVGAQFWSVFVPVDMHGAAAVQATLEQIDIVQQMAALYPNDLEMAYTASDIRRIHKAGRIGSLIGIEGGHQIDNSLAVLRQFYALGARYMTLTHVTNTAWADSATDTPTHQGLTPFGREVVREMNRLGMLVDLSHVAPSTMRGALEVSEAPVIFSHSSARALVDHPRNVPDDILNLVARNGGVVMVNFNAGYVSGARNQWDAARAAEKARYNSAPYDGLYVGQPERAKAAVEAWEMSHPAPVTTLADVADHIEHIQRVAGANHVGIGSDFDGIDDTPEGLESAAGYPTLLAELARRGWSDVDLAKVAGGNLLRVLDAAQRIGAQLQRTRLPSTATSAELDDPPRHVHPLNGP